LCGLLEAALPVNHQGEVFVGVRNTANLLADPDRY